MLHLDDNPLAEQGGANLAAGLWQSQSLGQLRLCNTGIADKGAIACQHLTCMAKAMNASVWEHRLRHIAGEQIQTALDCVRFSSLAGYTPVVLHKQVSMHSSKARQALHQPYASCYHLSCWQNRPAVKALSCTLQLHESLTGRCRCAIYPVVWTHAGVYKLAQALPHANQLTHLDLSSCMIGDEGASELAGAIADPFHGLNDKAMLNEEFHGAAPTPSYLQVLKLRDNQIGDQGVKELAEAMQQSSSLQDLDLAGNEVNHTCLACRKRRGILLNERLCVRGSRLCLHSDT